VQALPEALLAFLAGVLLVPLQLAHLVWWQ